MTNRLTAKEIREFWPEPLSPIIAAWIVDTDCEIDDDGNEVEGYDAGNCATLDADGDFCAAESDGVTPMWLMREAVAFWAEWEARIR